MYSYGPPHMAKQKQDDQSNIVSYPARAEGLVNSTNRTYIQQLCEDTGCNTEDLPKAMDDRE